MDGMWMVNWKAVNKGTIHLFGNRKATTIHSIKYTIESIPQVTSAHIDPTEKFSCTLFAHTHTHTHLLRNPLHHFNPYLFFSRVLLLWIPIFYSLSLCVCFICLCSDENRFANITPTELKRIICLFSADCLWLGAQTTRNSDFVHINRTSAGKYGGTQNQQQQQPNSIDTVDTDYDFTLVCRAVWE